MANLTMVKLLHWNFNIYQIGGKDLQNEKNNNNELIQNLKKSNLTIEEFDLLTNLYPNKRPATDEEMELIMQKILELEANNEEVDLNNILKELNLTDIAIATEEDFIKWSKRPGVVFHNFDHNKKEKLAIFQKIKELDFEIEKIDFDELLEQLNLKNIVKVSIEYSIEQNKKYLIIQDC